MGMGNAKVQSAAAADSTGSNDRRASSRPTPNRVEVSLLKNNLDQLASNSTTQTSASTTNSQPQQQ
jgi:hypothetical protein